MSLTKEMRVSDRAYAKLVSEIQTGMLAPGSVLGEVEQATRLGVSRTPMREAIGKLIANGLAQQLSPRTTVVSGFDLGDIKRLFEARRALEEAAARLAAKRADPQVFAKLAAGFSGANPTEKTSTDNYYALIAEFDEALDQAVDNAYMVQALSVIRTHLARARNLARDNQARLGQSAAEHKLIASAIADGDEELAAHATHVHLHNALKAIISSLSEG